MLELNKIYNENCLSFLDKIKKESIDLVLTDPPYNISRKNGFKTLGRNGIDFGKWDKNFNQKKWLIKVSKVVKKNGSLIIFNDWKNLGLMVEILDKEGFVEKDIIRWIKKNPMPRNINRRYVTDYEFALWAVKKGGKWTFNNTDNGYKRPEFKTSIFKKKRIHPTQKSLDLFKKLIQIHSNVGDLVLDCFMGSGTTGVACIETKRNFIGCEIDKLYFELSQKRLQNCNAPIFFK